MHKYKVVCRDCRNEQSIEDKTLRQCPQCGSDNIKIYDYNYKIYDHSSGPPMKLILIIIIMIILAATSYWWFPALMLFVVLMSGGT